MGIVSATKGSQSCSIGTEHPLATQIGLGIYILVVDTANMTTGDVVVIRIKSKYGTGGISRTAYTFTYGDIQAEPNKYSVPIPIDTEIACTIQQTSGVGKEFPWNLLRC